MKTFKEIDQWMEGLEEDQEETEDEPEMKEEYEQRDDPNHPYCTNWPVNKKGKNENL